MSTLKIFGSHEEGTLAQLRDVDRSAEYTALMADGHLGYIMPVGGVAAYRDKVSVAGVGYDIACGNCAILTDLRASELGAERLPAIADQIAAEISFGIGRKNRAADAPRADRLFESQAWSLIPASHREDLRAKAIGQLGTVGSGNHYVDVFADAKDRVWVGVHFGSRGLGHTIACAFLALASGGRWGDRVPEHDALLRLDSPLGADYWALMSLAGEYAYAGREWVTRKVVSILGGRELDLVHNHHNFAWRETHFEREVVVVRKGATPAFPGQRGFVGGSMGDSSVILRGASDEPAAAEQVNALYSTVHGAGRVMSRTQAAGKFRRVKAWVCGQRDCEGGLPIATRTPDGSNPRCPVCGSKMNRREAKELVRAGAVTPEMMNAWLGQRGVLLRGGGLDESPHAYRRLPEVLEAQGATIEVLEILTPLVVVMAGADEYDPYKD